MVELIKNNHMKSNANKCHLLVTRDADVTAKIGQFDVRNTRKEKLLGVKTDSQLSFQNHVSSRCKMASQKLHALSNVVMKAKFMDLAKRKSLMKAFITTRLNCYPLIWIFQIRQLNNRIKKIQERDLKLVYKDNNKLTLMTS